MSTAARTLASGKGHRDENFPVASFLIEPRHREAMLAFYRFARTADDVADHPKAPAADKLRLLDDMAESLSGHSSGSVEALILRNVLEERKLSQQHAFDLLEAFRRDVTKLRYADWDELMDYCRYSAMPVGRFILDVHGEDRSVWAYSDALCAALQVINHLQDCGKDFNNLNRVYLPEDTLSTAGGRIEDLRANAASPGLRKTIGVLAARTDELLSEARPFAGLLADFRLGLEVSVIQRLAESLVRMLKRNDPLSEQVHHSKASMLGLALAAASRFLLSPHDRRNSGQS